MKRTLTFLILFTCIFCCNTAFASKKVLVVLGSDGLIYRTAYDGLMESLIRGPASDIKTIVISRNTNRVVSRYMPAVVIAIGNNALKKLIDVKKIPVGYLLCTNLNRVKNKKNFFGIATDYDQCTLASLVKKYMLGVNSLAVIQSPDKHLNINNSRVCKSGIPLTYLVVNSSSELPTTLINNSRNVDAVAIDPYSEMLTQETIEYLFQFSLETQIPLISLRGKKMFSESAMLFDVDPIETGKGMADMVNGYLSTGVKALERVDSKWFSVRINKRMVKMLKLDVKTGM